MKTKQIKWRVAQPGTHGKGLRVVEDIGVAITGEPIAGAVCEISHSRSNSDGFSDAKEQARAQLIALSPELLEALRGLVAECKKLPDFHPSERRATALGAAIEVLIMAPTQITGKE